MVNVITDLNKSIYVLSVTIDNKLSNEREKRQ